MGFKKLISIALAFAMLPFLAPPKSAQQINAAAEYASYLAEYEVQSDISAAIQQLAHDADSTLTSASAALKKASKAVTTTSTTCCITEEMTTSAYVPTKYNHLLGFSDDYVDFHERGYSSWYSDYRDITFDWDTTAYEYPELSVSSSDSNISAELLYNGSKPYGVQISISISSWYSNSGSAEVTVTERFTDGYSGNTTVEEHSIHVEYYYQVETTTTPAPPYIYNVSPTSSPKDFAVGDTMTVDIAWSYNSGYYDKYLSLSYDDDIISVEVSDSKTKLTITALKAGSTELYINDNSYYGYGSHIVPISVIELPKIQSLGVDSTVIPVGKRAEIAVNWDKAGRHGLSYSYDSTMFSIEDEYAYDTVTYVDFRPLKTGTSDFTVIDKNGNALTLTFTVTDAVPVSTVTVPAPTTTTTTTTTTTSTTTTTVPSTILIEVVAGDANDDGTVSVADATLIMQYLASPSIFKLTNTQKRLADVSETSDGVTAEDALIIQRYLAGNITSLPYNSAAGKA